MSSSLAIMFLTKNQVNALRHIPLEQILLALSAKKDSRDRAKWHTSKGVISVTGCKFFNWSQNKGGGGAIDLAMHLADLDFRQTLLWLQSNCSLQYNTSPLRSLKDPPQQRFVPPGKNDVNMARVMRYLHDQRCIPTNMIHLLARSGRLYADNRQNAVFLLLGKEKQTVGAELVGTGNAFRWRGMAPGSKKNLGYFSISTGQPDHVVLCESAVDAMSYCTLHLDCLAISTAGVTTSPGWLKEVTKLGLDVLCGFDADDAGNSMAGMMIKKHPFIQRKRPPQKDWNKTLCFLCSLL